MPPQRKKRTARKPAKAKRDDTVQKPSDALDTMARHALDTECKTRAIKCRGTNAAKRSLIRAHNAMSSDGGRCLKPPRQRTANTASPAREIPPEFVHAMLDADVSWETALRVCRAVPGAPRWFVAALEAASEREVRAVQLDAEEMAGREDGIEMLLPRPPPPTENSWFLPIDYSKFPQMVSDILQGKKRQPARVEDFTFPVQGERVPDYVEALLCRIREERKQWGGV